MTIRPSFEWVPGQGPDPASLERMMRAFPKPKAPMGEAWFMSETRRMFPELAGDIDTLSTWELDRALEEIASGPASFGQFEEWTEWYHYLLPRIVRRSHEAFVIPLLEILITAFMSQHPSGLAREPYSGFREDVLATLGRAMMMAECWPGGHPDLFLCLNKSYMPGAGRWLWDEASGKLSASMFFCLKYLDADAVEPWFKSILDIRSTHWRAQLLVWLVGAHGLLTGAIQQPAQLGEDKWPTIEWNWSHCLTGNYTGSFTGQEPISEFLPAANRRRLLHVVHQSVAAGVIPEWVDAFARYPDLVGELLNLPERCVELYSAPPV